MRIFQTQLHFLKVIPNQNQHSAVSEKGAILKYWYSPSDSFSLSQMIYKAWGDPRQ